MARTDAFAQEGIERVIERSNSYIEAGADSIFPEAIIVNLGRLQNSFLKIYLFQS